MSQPFRWSLIVAGLAAALTVVFVAAQPTLLDVSKKSDPATDELKSYKVDKKQEAVAAGRKLVRAADQEIKDLEKAAANAGSEARANLRKEIKSLKAQRALASRKLYEMGKATEAAWDKAKQGFVDAYRDLHQSVEKATARLKS